MRVSKLIKILLAAITLVLAVPTVASASGMYLGTPGYPIKSQSTPDIVLEKHVMQVWLRSGFAEIEDVYQFYNEGESQTFAIGAPEKVNNKSELNYGIYNFSAYVDGNPVDVNTAKTNDEAIGFLRGTVNWHKHGVFIAEGQRRVVVHRYWIRVSPWDRKMVLPLRPSSSWKGTVGRADYIIHLMGDLSEENIIYPAGYGNKAGQYAIEPGGFKANRNQIRWEFTNYEPDRDIELQIFVGKSKTVSKVTASSVHKEDKKVYVADYAVDGDPVSAWGVGGPGKGESLTVSFKGKRWVREFRVIPGYGQLESMYKYYNRPHKVTLRFSDGTSQQFEIQDSLDMQYFPVKPVHTSYVKIDIDSIYKGVYLDLTYVSEVEFGEFVTDKKVSPSAWKIGLGQVKVFKAGSGLSKYDLITVAVAAAVFIAIAWQVFVAIRRRFKKDSPS